MQEDRFTVLIETLVKAIAEIDRIKQEIREENRRGIQRLRQSINPDVPTPRREREEGR